jgi:Cu-Zn family superoxide dismutase
LCFFKYILGFHGLHVHENGNADANCTLTGLHFNPDNVTHGGPNAAVHHAGDLGNVATSPSGKTKVRILNRQLSLDPNSRYYIVGRSMAVHINADDLGLGGTAASLTVGSSGLRVGCGIIIASYHH